MAGIIRRWQMWRMRRRVEHLIRLSLRMAEMEAPEEPRRTSLGLLSVPAPASLTRYDHEQMDLVLRCRQGMASERPGWWAERN